MKKAYLIVLALLVSSPLIWLWGFGAIAAKVAISAAYLLTILFITRKWIL